MGELDDEIARAASHREAVSRQRTEAEQRLKQAGLDFAQKAKSQHIETLPIVRGRIRKDWMAMRRLGRVQLGEGWVVTSGESNLPEAEAGMIVFNDGTVGDFRELGRGGPNPNKRGEYIVYACNTTSTTYWNTNVGRAVSLMSQYLSHQLSRRT